MFFSKLDPVSRATLIGLAAPVCWGMSVSLVRGIAEGFGLAQGQCLLYIVASCCLYFMVGMPDFKKMDKRYLFIAIPTANLSSLAFCLALFYSEGGAQTLEVGMVNYLWPAFTILCAVVFNRVPARWWLYGGIIIAFWGIATILNGSAGFSFSSFFERVQMHPLSYFLALCSAVTWAAFSSMTKAWGGRHNPSTLIFMIDAAIFCVLWFCGIGKGPSEPTMRGIASVAVGGLAMGAAYASWTTGMAKGNITVLAAASYFTPVLSCLFGVFWLGACLQAAFWTGVAYVVGGSLLCWTATLSAGKRLKTLPQKTEAMKKTAETAQAAESD